MVINNGLDVPKEGKGRIYFVLLIALGILMILAAFATLISFVDALYAAGNIWWMTAGALVTVVFTGFVCCSDGFHNVLVLYPNGISTRISALGGWKTFLRYCVWAIFGIGLIAGICLMVSARYDGVVESSPILADRDIYQLNSHGKLTTVSRARYIVVGVSFEIAFTCGLLGTETSIIYVLLYNEPPFGSKEGGIWSVRKRRRN
jgi:hypothetical protein